MDPLYQRWHDLIKSAESIKLDESLIHNLYRSLGCKAPKVMECSGPLSCAIAQIIFWQKPEYLKPYWISKITQDLIETDDAVAQVIHQSKSPNLKSFWAFDKLSLSIDFSYIPAGAGLRSQVESLIVTHLNGICFISTILGSSFNRLRFQTMLEWLDPRLFNYFKRSVFFPRYIRALICLQRSYSLNPIDELLIQIATCCEALATLPDIAFVQARASVMQFDNQNRFHCENGPAIKWRDGFSVYAWHDVCVPKHWIEGKATLSSSEVLHQDNAELRRVGCEILGWNRILNELKCEIVDEDLDPLIGTLLETNLPGSGKERFLKVKCGTGRDFVIPVPPESPSAKWANAWTYGMQDDLGSFRPRLRT